MNFLFSIKEPVLILLTLVAYFLAFGQTLHVMLISTSGKAKNTPGARAYETLLVLHLLLACFVSNSAHFNFGRILFRMRALSLDIEPMMWANATIFALGLVLLIRHKKPIMTPELCILALSTPPFISLSGGFSWLLLFADLAFFLFRVSASLLLDLKRASSQITPLSIGETLKKLPEGVLVSTNNRILFMNDSMRDELVSLGLGGHLMKNVNVWEKIGSLEKNESRKSWQPCFIKTKGARTLMFSRDERMCGKRLAEQIVAVDVTAITKLNEEIEATNTELLKVNVELSKQLKNLEETCKQEAALQMHKRVHDEIGQRLSILHQWLESSNSEEITQTQAVELVSNITTKLRKKEIEPEDELASVIDAFAQAGVTITITGDGPQLGIRDQGLGTSVSKRAGTEPTNPYSLVPSPSRGDGPCLAEILREAATNALKHGHAQNVWVNIYRGDNSQAITITNDGEGAKMMPELGCGLRSMKAKIESAGGTFEISSTDPFTIVVTFENKDDEND